MKDATGPGALPCVVRCPDGDVEVLLRWSDDRVTVADVVAEITDRLTEVAALSPPPLQVTIGGHPLDGATPVGQAGIRPGEVLTLRRAGPGAAPRREPRPSGPVPARRPPRPPACTLPPPIRLPDAPRPANGSSAISVAGVVVPAVMAAVLVVALHNVVWGLFSLLGPVVAVATGIEQHRRGSRRLRRDEQRFRGDLVALAHDLHGMAATERRRRRRESPAAAEVASWPADEHPRMWERRAGDPDWLRLRLGTGDVGWQVPTAAGTGAGTAAGPGDVPELDAMLGAASVLSDTPVTVDLSARGVIGLAGPRPEVLGVARSLVVQAGVLHGPGDLALAVVTDERASSDWAWSRWLPHVVDPDAGPRRVTGGPAGIEALRRACRDQRTTHGMLVVLDDQGHEPMDRARARTSLRARGAGVAAIVVAETERDLPSCCTAVVQIDASGRGELRTPETAPSKVSCERLPVATARAAARALARFEDPDSPQAGVHLPADLTLSQATGAAAGSPEAIGRGWDASADHPPAAVVGVSLDGPLVVDLALDGPHVLLAGTTGSGKSELLRTLVVGLALACPPEQLSFVLIDFKGGSTFDRCGALPHVVGTITDLDGHQVQRAIEGLEAELVRREELLRAAGADDLPAYRGAPHRDHLARLVVVIDEFATLATEHPGALEALVGIAQRGRSMGVHLVLATQRPTGSVSDHIRANTNLRIALRVQDAADSTDVIGVPDASTLSRKRPGRALVRLGPGEVIQAQVARTSGAPPGDRPSVVLEPFEPARDGPGPTPLLARAVTRPRPHEAGPDVRELDQLVDAIVAAHAQRGGPPPHRPWPDPLPHLLPLDQVEPPGARDEDRAAPYGPASTGIVFARADEPSRQHQIPIGWDPERGNLLVAGAVASGTTTALAAIALRASRGIVGSACHLHVLDFGSGELSALADLPVVGNVIGPGERERQRRLVDHLARELARRQSAGRASRELPATATGPRIVVLVDGAEAFAAAWGDPQELVLERFGRVLADGPRVGIHVAFTIAATGGVPRRWIAGTRQRVVLSLADPADEAHLGVRRPATTTTRPGRATWVEHGLLGQIGWPGHDLAAAVATTRAHAPTPCLAPPRIATLPARVPTSSLTPGDVSPTDRTGPDPWRLPVGIGDHDLGTVAVVLHPGEHALVAGPARSGRTSALTTLATVARAAAGRDLAVVAIAADRSPLCRAAVVDESLTPDRLAALADLVREATAASPVLVVADDIETIDDADRHLATLLAEHPPHAHRIHVIGAGRAEALRGAYQHWSRPLRAAGVGILLRPSLDLDGDLLGATLPRRHPAEPGPGRGWLVDHGRIEFLQVAIID
jgi:S-DNA-T family DNA segregation ATPase FtsK/SpoIIIE